jgi:drug/metabolite transporter (DMT)-like permease
MDPLIIFVVLCAACTHATWNTLVKVGNDPLMTAAILNIATTVIAITLVPVVGLPDPGTWPYLIGSVITHTGYFICLTNGYRLGDLSHVYPLARGSGPIYAAILTYFVVGEALNPTGITAVAIICAAILSLTFVSGRITTGGKAPVLYALATGMFIGSYTLIDGLGVRVAGTPFNFIVWVFVLHGFPVIALAFWQRRETLRASLAANWKRGALGGALGFIGYSLVLWAMTTNPIALVSALRETSVIIAALIGTKILGEPFGRPRVAAAFAVACGIVLLQAAGRA